MLSFIGDAQLSDFGLSCHINDEIIDKGGTPVYMSPNTLKSWK